MTASPQAQAGTLALTYDVTLEDGVSGVSQILSMNEISDGESYGWPFSLSSGSSSFTTAYPTSFPPVEATIAIGLVTNLPGDPAGVMTTHLAVFGNFTTGQIGESFSALFPDANEGTLISDLTNIFVNNADLTQATSTFRTDVLPLFNDASSDGLFIPPGGNLDVVAFTDGQLIGTGTFEITTVPEPSSLSLLLLGIVILGLSWTVKLRAARSCAGILRTRVI
jgi:hypothetical protein